MSNLLTRILSGIVIVAVVAVSILLNEYSLLLFALSVFVLSFYEFRNMFQLRNKSLFGLTIFLGILMIFILYLTVSSTIPWFWASIYLISAGSAIILYYMLSTGISMNEISHSIFGMLWTSGSLVFFLASGWIGNSSHYEPLLLIVLISLIWVNDIGAYLFGSIFGKNYLAKAISPGKTVEGFISGILLTGLAGWVVFIFTDTYNLIFWIITGIIISLASTAGDLFESKMKRDAGVKDSGNLIPGHGGFLDRFDSLFFSAPVYFIILSIWKSLS